MRSPLEPERPDPFGTLRPALRSVRVRVLLHRRWLAAGCLALAVHLGLEAVKPPVEPGVAVTVAAADLPSGTVLSASELTTRRFLPGSVPDHLPDDLLGRTLAAPVSRGEPLTAARVVSPKLAEHLDGRTGVPVRITDADAVGLLAVGDRIDLVASDQRSGAHERVARQALVLALPAPRESSGAAEGRLVMVGVTPTEADALAAASGAVLQLQWSAPPLSK